MSVADADISITSGVEEEFLLVDPVSRDLIADPDIAIFETCEHAAGTHKVVREFLRSQIETNARVRASIAELRTDLRETRTLVADGAVAMAASAHPCADWRAQATTPRERYRNFAATYQESVRRFLVAGMHGNADSRVRAMTALRRYLPVLHALSPSSPFNAGRETGFKSYRLNLMSALPRTNLPPSPHSRADFDLLGEDYKFLDFVEDGSELWRDIPAIVPLPHRGVAHLRHLPPLEDALSVVALYAALVRKLAHLDADGALPPEPLAERIAKNRGLASRHSVLAFLGDVDAGGHVIDDYLARLVGDLDADARALGCEHEMLRVQAIIREGTGADRQIDHFRLRRLEGDRDDEALR